MDRVSVRSGDDFGGWWIQPRSHPLALCGSAFTAGKQLACCSGSGLSSLNHSVWFRAWLLLSGPCGLGAL